MWENKKLAKLLDKLTNVRIITYTVETGRSLCIRIEDLDDLRKGNVQTPSGEHRVLCHAGALLEISFLTLRRESDLAGNRTRSQL